MRHQGPPPGVTCTPKCTQLALIIIVSVVIYTTFYSVSLAQQIRTEIDTLKSNNELAILRQKLEANVDQVHVLSKKLNETQRELALQKHRINLAFTKGKYPFQWERCMRFEYRKKCDDPDNPNLPPCQIEILKEMAHVFIEAMEKAQMEYYLGFGTLLGAVRDGQIIPWTGDVDFVLKQELFKIIDQTLKKTKVLQNNGYHFFIDPDYPDLGRMCITEQAKKFAKWEKKDPEPGEYYNHYPYVDIYQAVDKPNDYIGIKHGPNCLYKRSTIYPLKRIELNGDLTWQPANSTRFLTQVYGPNFIEPPKEGNRHGHGAYSDACKPEWQDL